MLIFCALCVTACSGRASLTPEQAIIGHWMNERGDVHYFFTKDAFTIVEAGKAPPPVQYRVTEIRDKSNQLMIDVGPPGQPARRLTLTFSDDRRSLVTTDELQGIRLPPARWSYVDAEQAPQYIED
ncbi:MAG TPA: hypothetical protein VF747_06700 [Blastocatellia bacterium]